MKKLREKLHSRRGSSVVLALFVMLIAVMISTVVLRTALTNMGRASGEQAEEQAYLTVSSAASMLRVELGELGFSWNDIEEPGVLHESAGSALAPLLREMVAEIRTGRTITERSFTVETADMDTVSVTLSLTNGWALRGDLALAGHDLSVNNRLTLRTWGVEHMDAEGTVELSFPESSISKGGT